MPEVGGRVDFGAEDHEQKMMALGLQSKREITRTRIRVRTAMAAQTREQGGYLGGRAPYRYRPASERGPCGVGPAGAPAGARPADSTGPDPARPPNAYIREDQILPRLPAMGILVGAPGRRSRKRSTAQPPVPDGVAAMISYLRAQGITLIYDPDEHTLRAGAHGPVAVTTDRKTPAARR
jgi:hypothetical protein